MTGLRRSSLCSWPCTQAHGGRKHKEKGQAWSYWSAPRGLGYCCELWGIAMPNDFMGPLPVPACLQRRWLPGQHARRRAHTPRPDNSTNWALCAQPHRSKRLQPKLMARSKWSAESKRIKSEPAVRPWRALLCQLPRLPCVAVCLWSWTPIEAHCAWWTWLPAWSS